MEANATGTEKHRSFDAMIKEQCTFWQDVLRLRDWNVDVRVVRAHELDGDIAQTEYWDRRKDAIIRITHPMDVQAMAGRFLGGEEQDYDLHLVHELLHLHFSSFAAEKGTPQELSQERAIESISRAIVRMYREGNPILITLPARMEGTSYNGSTTISTPSMLPAQPSATGHYV